MTDIPKKIYWDSCIWLALIKEESGRVGNCNSYIDEAKRGRVEIWTSSLTCVEVFKVNCSENNSALQQEKGKEFEAYLDPNFVFEVAIDREIGTISKGINEKALSTIK